jgi:hypothetical protein
LARVVAALSRFSVAAAISGFTRTNAFSVATNIGASLFRLLFSLRVTANHGVAAALSGIGGTGRLASSAIGGGTASIFCAGVRFCAGVFRIGGFSIF